MEVISSFYLFLEILGTVAFAISGTVVGINHKLDIFGILVMSVITAVGGVEFYSKGVHVRNVAVTVNSNGAEATGDVIQRGNWRDISCSFSFTDTNQMHKLKVSRGRMKFHKMTDEAKQAKRERKEARKAERQAKRDAKKAEKAAKKAEKSKKKSFLFF